MFNINLNMSASFRYCLTIPALLLFCLRTSGQEAGGTAESYIEKAGIFHRNYQFEKAVEYYTDALEHTADSILRLEIMDRIVECQNGQSMMQYIVRPELKASGTFHEDEFFLYINDFEDNSWIPVPNPFIKAPERLMNRFYTSMYFPDGCRSIIFSAPDIAGVWNIYTSSWKDSVWSAPVLLSENILSDRNEIFPVISADGKTLYFASDGLPGMGGYDLFRSTWNEETGDWNVPENMGFPYSSPCDDIMFLDCRSGEESIIVSNREAGQDSVTVYVTGTITTPVKTPLGKDESPILISSFVHRYGHPDKSESGTRQQETDSYSVLMHQLRRLQEDQRSKLDKIEESRRIYERALDEDKEFLAGIIRDIEQESMDIKIKIDDISAKVRKMEAQFLAEGIFPDSYEDNTSGHLSKVPAAAAVHEYIFRKHTPGRIPYIIVENPEPEFDYSFKILERDKGQFAEDYTLPPGIVFQIQFAALPSHGTIKDIRGMSPVFVTKSSSSKYIHTVGLFRTYQEALTSLNRVKKNGFRDAFIVAFNDGKKISTVTARNMLDRSGSSSGTSDAAWQVILSGYDSSLPQSVLAIVQKHSTKDITRSEDEDGHAVFAIGPFGSKEEAESLAGKLNEDGIETSLESFKI